MKISNTASKVALGSLGGWIIAAVVVWLFGDAWFAEVEETIPYSVSGLMIIASLALSSIFLLVLGGTYKLSSSMGKVWAMLGVGMLLWLAGEAIYFWLDYQTLVDPSAVAPFPSIADIFYYVAYLPLTAGLVIQMRLLKLTLGASEKAVVSILSVLASIIIGYFVLWPAVDAFIADPVDPLGTFAGALYTILDIILLVCVFTVSAKLRHGKINAAWISILAGLVLTSVADSLYWIADNQGIDIMFNWYDLAFLVGYLLISMGTIKGINVISTSFSS